MRGFSLSPSVHRPRSRARSIIASSLLCVPVLLATADADAGVPPPQVVPGQIVLQQGETPTMGAAVATVNSPFVNDAGEVGFVGLFEDGDNYVFIGNTVVWSGSDEPMILLDALEPRMDSNGAGNWVYAIDADGADGLYTDAGYFAAAGDAAAMPMGATYTFLGNPTMASDGTIYYVAGIDLNGDGGAEASALYRTPDGTPGSAEVVYAGGDMIDMDVLAPFGYDFNYSLSKDGVHLASLMFVEGDPASDQLLRVDDMIVVREGDPTGDGDNWAGLSLVSVNAGGNYILSGDTDGPGDSDNFLAYNGTIAVRQGDMLDGVVLGFQSNVRFLALSDLDQAAYSWAYQGPAGFRESVFFACDAADIAGSTQTILTSIDDQLDVDGDGMGDYTITDVNTTQPTSGRAIGETQFLYVGLGLDDGGGEFYAMVEIPLSCCGNGAVNPFEDCDDGNMEDTDDCLSTCVAASCGDGFIQDGVEECDDGNDDDTDECPTNCLDATCGDGFVLDGVEECDDGNDDDTDDCLSDCVPASCGDGFVQDGVEECDDGNDDDTDDCLSDCTLPAGADDTTTGDDTGTGTGDTGGGSGPGPGTLTNGTPTSGGGTDTEGETDTDTDSAGGVEDPGGCGCHTDTPRLPGLLWSLMGLGLLGLGRRRRR